MNTRSGTDPEIRTAAGVVRGRWEGTLAVFRGIPYAEPPFGPRRFRSPVRAQGWDGIRVASEFGPPVPQSTCPGSVMTSLYGSATDGSGDCLTLNVWSPDLSAAGLPVMVWIHGGAYREGTSGNPHHDGATLAKAGVVMVSMNYRTGVEGFAHIAGAPDNRGILDQAAALHWVQDNIAEFGGDPAHVTVFGQSAGAGCIAALLAMPLAAGLFRRAIAMSVPGTFFTPRLAGAVTSAITAELGVGPTLDEMAPIPPRSLLDATNTIIRRMPEFVDSWGPMALTPTPFSPVVDGDLLPLAPWRALGSGAARNVDLLVGHTRDEYHLLTPHSADEAAAKHLADWLFRMPTLHLADARHRGGGKAWLYELCWAFNSDEGASHSLDFLLVLGTLTPADVRNHPAAHKNAASELAPVSHNMRTEWVNFATTGNPGWTPYNPNSRPTRLYHAAPTTHPYPEETSRQTWSAHRFDTLDLAE
ncbi:carboxylesterase/lipase family protein [Nocardia sp. NPDC004722]